jgi:hypothetical protein
MMIEVRDYNKDGSWEPIDFYTSALADVPLTLKTSNGAYTVKKRFSSLFKHNSSLSVQSKVRFSLIIKKKARRLKSFIITIYVSCLFSIYFINIASLFVFCCKFLFTTL